MPDAPPITGAHPDLTALLVPLDQLHQYHRNPNNGDTDVIAESLRANGQYRPIVVNRGTLTGRPDEVLGGNHTYAAALELGWTHIAATHVDVDDDRAARIVAVDNRSAELARRDPALLAELLGDLPDLQGTGYTQDYLDELLADLPSLPGDAGDPDDTPPAPDNPTTATGDLWLLGSHRVLCGDSSDPSALDRVLAGDKVECLLTDPPYGMSLDTDYRSMGSGSTKALLKGTAPKAYRPVIGDDQPYDAGPLAVYVDNVPEQFWFGADYYRRTLPAPDNAGAWLVWDKRSETSDNGFGSGFELLWSRQKHQRRVLRHFHFGAFGADARNRVHPTQKPVPLLEDILNRWAPGNAVVLDPYGGSGSTLIACDRTGRRARLVELDPRYVDVICRRYQQATGTLPVLEQTGEPHDFTADAPASSDTREGADA